MAEQYATPTVINTAVPAPTVADVYSTQNIAQTATAPVQAPVSAGQELYNQFLNTPDIQAAKANVSAIQKQINEANQSFRNAKTGFEYQNEGAMGTTGASANLIGRQIGRASDLTSNTLAGLGENLSAQQAYLDSLTSEASNRYNIAQQERNQIQGLITATKGKANITYADSYEDALQKAAKYEEKVLKEERKQAEKDELKKTLKSLGLSTSGLSRNEMEKKLKKYMKSEKAKEEEIRQIEIALKKKSLAGSSSEKTNANDFYATATSLKNSGKSWGDIADTLGKKYDLTPGSDYSNQLDAIMTGKATTKLSDEELSDEDAYNEYLKIING